MKIVYLIDQFYKHGGIEKMLSLKINHFIEHYGYEVILITSQHPKEQTFVYPLNNKVTHVDLKINYLIGKSYFYPNNLTKAFRHCLKLRKQLKRLKPDVIVSAGFSPEQYFLPLIVKKTPIIKEFHFSGVILNKKRNKILNNFLFKQFKKYDAVVVLNEDERKYFNFKNLVVIPNFIELKDNLSIVSRNKTIIAAGRIAEVKQFDHLIKAWHKIATQFPDWDVKIFGDGDDKLSSKLNEQILQNKIPRIELMGATPHLAMEMQKASIYAMTSANECFPMVLLEAQNAGLPIVSYDCPNGPRNIITNNIDGLLVKNQSIDEFANNLSYLITENDIRLNMGAKAKINSFNFAPAPIMEKWNKLFLSLR